jgi:heme-degrading monooxygenase HmoA
MIMREWRARAGLAGVDASAAHFQTHVLPLLAGVEGFRGAYLARRNTGNEFELVVLTMWESLDAVRAFAGPDLERAVIQPAARHLLTTHDDEVHYYDILATFDAG